MPHVGVADPDVLDRHAIGNLVAETERIVGLSEFAGKPVGDGGDAVVKFVELGENLGIGGSGNLARAANWRESSQLSPKGPGRGWPG